GEILGEGAREEIHRAAGRAGRYDAHRVTRPDVLREPGDGQGHSDGEKDRTRHGLESYRSRPSSADGACLDQLAQRGGQQSAQSSGPLRLATLPRDAEADDRQAHYRKREREDDAVPEDLVRQVAE